MLHLHLGGPLGTDAKGETLSLPTMPPDPGGGAGSWFRLATSGPGTRLNVRRLIFFISPQPVTCLVSE